MRNQLDRTFVVSIIGFLLMITSIQLSVTAQEIQVGTEIAWSPDGEMIAVAYGSSVQIVEMDTGNLVASTSSFTDRIRKIAWNPDNTRFAVAIGSEVQIWEIGAQQPSLVFTGQHQNEIISISWSPNGDQIVSASMQNALVWQVDTGAILHHFAHDPGPLLSAFWSPDGTRIATGGFDSLVLFWDAGTGELLGGISMPRQTGIISVSILAWNPNGDLLATAASDDVVRVWDGLSNYPLEVQAFFGLADAATSLAWSPNAVDLARGGLNGEISIWDVQTGELIDNIRAGIAVKSLAYSPYGGRLAYGGTIPSDSSALSSNQTDISDAGETLAGGAVHIVVPAPSLERLQAVADACNAPTAVERALPTSAVASQLSTFVANVEALPENTIPPACAADLVAVAEALQSR